MAEQYVIKTHEVKTTDTNGNVSKTTKEIKYRVDADFVPTKISDISIEFIENYVDANDKGEWMLNALSQKEVIKKAKKAEKIGTEKDISFVGLRALFVKEFFPEILIGQEKPISKIEELRKKYGK